jgi:integrase/recombinase XerD
MGRPLTIYRRHLANCKNHLRTQRNCQCPMWAQGTLRGKWIRRSLGVRSWEAAQKLVREWEADGMPRTATVERACEAFVRDCEARKLSSQTVKKYRRWMNELKGIFQGRLVGSLDAEDMRSYREGWELSPVSALKKLEGLRTFFRFCDDAGWIGNNPARSLKAPKVVPNPTLPFTKDEMEKILWATELYPTAGIHGKKNPLRAKAMVLLLRYSGMRVGDAATLTRDRIQNGKLFLYTAKTKTPVFVPLPKEVIDALEKLEETGKYFFWSGYGTVKAATSGVQRTLYRVFKLAGITNGHAHRFRDTFSVSLLESGVSLETVSVLLGHSNTRITAKHYNPWVKSRQAALEEAVTRAWQQT